MKESKKFKFTNHLYKHFSKFCIKYCKAGLKLFVIIAIIIFMYEEYQVFRKELNEYEYIRYTDAHRT